ncbi:kinase-like domain-containing protein [Lasiosphaeria miniovina]|uniref:non-specific serine/threonine protein kinase n=1 Tax=Lasiosphaeria miniovina TaxID=1954250 RepID=A0AA40AJZ7_9PEZI|nr:kinase-like domain-containing protein [Lasiosphaeria miniovina]KAK0717165.1 kinase-like domain-containing protein [Lasiosphaeria miniovina]
MSEGDKYDVLEKIGHGSFGVIRKVRRKMDGMILCRKEISYLKMSQKEREQLHAEFQILSTLRHPNIVGYYHREHLKASQDLHLYMEYCGNGDLGRVIRDLASKNQYAEESFVWSTFSQLVTALYRCHYGVDPPEVGKTVLGLGTAAKPKAPTGGMIILHRDLKPENVFLGADNSVKLGDFGLSKVMQSHDFASTYVGTPFYMSPEICAAEKYTLKSDIWSLGCIIYELCSREPPFNAKSHFQLVQKIKEGKVAPLPPVYSVELMAVIKDCLRVNPDRRPDTATLLNLPVVRLMRKEKEVVEFSNMLKAKEDSLNKRIRELDQKLASVDNEKVAMRQEIDSSLRREWEVKARLEIDRLVGIEIEQLQRKFEQEVQARVEAELQSRRKAVAFSEDEPAEFSSSKSDYPHSSIGCESADGEFSSTTDLTELSVDSPDTSTHVLKKSARTPFARAQTMFVGVPAGTPMDVEMASPSPITIASLSLSPRRNAATKVPANPSNIFTANLMARGDARWEAPRDIAGMASDDESDDETHMPSPTRMIKSSKNPFTSKQRPTLLAQKSAPLHRLQSKQTLAPQARTMGAIPTAASNPDLHGLHRAGSNGALRERSNSPNRRLTKIPSATNLNGCNNKLSSGSDGSAPALSRKPSIIKKEPEQPPQQQQPQPPVLNKVAGKNNNIRGRTLVELQQARAGGRPLSAVMSGENLSPTRPFREHAAAANRGGSGSSEPAAVWDPERDEMPSPFLVRRKPIIRT